MTTASSCDFSETSIHLLQMHDLILQRPFPGHAGCLICQNLAIVHQSFLQLMVLIMAISTGWKKEVDYTKGEGYV
jgi:hypothetical protein